MSEFSNRFRQLKDESGLSSKELSQKLDIAPSTLSYYLKDREPNYDMLIKIADYFDVTIDWLVGNDMEQNITLLKIELINLQLENKKLLNKINEMKSQLTNLVEKLQCI